MSEKLEFEKIKIEEQNARLTLKNYFENLWKNKEAAYKRLTSPMETHAHLESLDEKVRQLEIEIDFLKKAQLTLESGKPLEADLKGEIEDFFKKVKEGKVERLRQLTEERAALEKTPVGLEYRENEEKIKKWKEELEGLKDLEMKQEYERLIISRTRENNASLFDRKIKEEAEAARALSEITALEEMMKKI